MNENLSPQTAAKPLGIILVGIYTGINGLLSVLTGVGLMFAGAVISHAWAPIFGFAMLLFGVMAFAAVYGIWTLAPWGHSLGRIIYSVSIPLGLVALLMDRAMGNIVLQAVGIALAIWILIYLTKPEIKSLFRAS